MVDLIGFMWFFLAIIWITLVAHKDFSPPVRLAVRYKIKGKSIFGKVLNKIYDIEGRVAPLDYFRVVPLCIYFFAALILTILGVVDIFLGGTIQQFFTKSVEKTIALIMILAYAPYCFMVHIWWSIERKKSDDVGMSLEMYEIEEELRKLRKEEEKVLRKQKRKQDKKK